VNRNHEENFTTEKTMSFHLDKHCFSIYLLSKAITQLTDSQREIEQQWYYCSLYCKYSLFLIRGDTIQVTKNNSTNQKNNNNKKSCFQNGITKLLCSLAMQWKEYPMK